MTPQLTVFLALSGIALIAWLAFRSRWYREALEDLEGMRNAPENKEGPSGLQNANPFYQMAIRRDEDPRRPH